MQVTEIVINNTSVDVYKNIPISLNFSVADIRNPEKRNTSFSKTITIPGSKKNNLLFGHIFEVSKESNSDDLQNFSPDFNPAIKAPCTVYSDTLYQMGGYCQLLKVIKNKNSFEYEICIFGVLGDFFTNIEGKYLTDLDFSEYSHELNQSNIEASWASYIKKDGVNYTNFNNTYTNNYAGELSVPDMDEVGILNSLGAVINVSDTVFINNIAYTITLKTVFPIITYYGLSSVVVSATPFITVSTGSPLTSIPIGEGYIYPCINYGYGTSMYQYDALTMYPALYLKSYIDKIFEIAGFTYSGSFKDLELFKRLVIPASSNVERVSDSTKFANSANQDYIVDTVIQTSSPTLLGLKKAVLLFPNTINDVSNLFDVTNGVYTVKRSGMYEIIVNYNITVVGNTVVGGVQDGVYVPGIVYINAEGTTIQPTVFSPFANPKSITYYQDGTFTGQFKIPSQYLNQGNKVRVFLNAFNGNAVTVNTGMELLISPLSIPTQIGDTFLLNSVVPKNVLLKDLVLSWFKMFNLYASIDPNNSNNIIVESAKDFYNNNEVVDWTNKLDSSSPIEILPVSEIEGKNYVFAYKEDGDYYNKFYKETYKEIYGNRDVSIINDFVKGKKEISVVFSPTISADTPLNKMVVPHILTREDDGTFSPFDSNIRILYYGGLKPCEGTFKIKYAADVIYTNYPYVGHVDDPYSPNIDLCFEIPKVLYWNTSVYTTANLYNVYYRKFIDEITDKNSKLLKGKFRLRASDIFAMDFKNFIQIDNINYRLNRVLDYSPIEPGLCIVELSKIKNGIDYTAYQIDVNPNIIAHLIQGGLDEVRSLTATSYIQLIQGGLDEVQALFSDSDIKIINGGTD